MKYKFFTKIISIFYIVSIVLLTFFSIVISAYKVSIISIVGVWCLWLLPATFIVVINYLQKQNFYKQLLESGSQLDDKYLLSAVIECPNFEEGQMIFHILEEYGNACYANVARAKNDSRDYREYIEQWVHEIKTPVAAVKLLAENCTDSRMMLEELVYIESYVDQVLYYARCQNPEKDFFVNKVYISDIVDTALKSQARLFISNKVRLQYEKSDIKILADSKWVIYILKQILSNGIKYSNGDVRIISIFGNKQNESYVLTIQDTGIGIPACDLSRVFEKGFTGENGRKFSRSTGMGLYICKQLCQKLNVGLDITSQVGIGTAVHLAFPLA